MLYIFTGMKKVLWKWTFLLEMLDVPRGYIAFYSSWLWEIKYIPVAQRINNTNNNALVNGAQQIVIQSMPLTRALFLLLRIWRRGIIYP